MKPLFSLVYADEAPYPRVVVGTGQLVDPVVRVVSPLHVEGGDSALNPCCVVYENLERKDSGRPDLLMTVCRKCHRRHFKGLAESGHIGLRLG